LSCTEKRKKTVVGEREKDRGEEGRTGGQTGAERGGGRQDVAAARALPLPALPERRGCGRGWGPISISTIRRLPIPVHVLAPEPRGEATRTLEEEARQAQQAQEAKQAGKGRGASPDVRLC
jgi:hypothetical protein